MKNMSNSENNSSFQAIIDSLTKKAQANPQKIGFPDALDIRVFEACKYLLKHSIAIPYIIGDPDLILQMGKELSISIDTIPILNPKECIHKEDIIDFYESRKSRGITYEQASSLLMDNPLYSAGIMLKKGMIDGCVAGNISSTANIIKAGLQTVGKQEGIDTISSFFIMVLPDGTIYTYADGAVVPSPNSQQLCDIAYSTAKNIETILGIQPRVAFLSFSTKGSASHPDIEKVQNAYSLFTNMYPDIKAEGELQFDAAIIPSIAKMKINDSILQGTANIFIFPNLDAGNIAYKITERLAGAKAIGPIIQGLSKPYFDLSRGCSIEDIVLVSTICCISK
jgi:phosphate acetyltransferase